jgi:hypothetical protein
LIYKPICFPYQSAINIQADERQKFEFYKVNEKPKGRQYFTFREENNIQLNFSTILYVHLVLIELILIAKSYCRQQDIFYLVTDQTDSEDSFTAK